MYERIGREIDSAYKPVVMVVGGCVVGGCVVDGCVVGGVSNGLWFRYSPDLQKIGRFSLK